MPCRRAAASPRRTRSDGWRPAPLADFVAGLARDGVFGAGRQPSLRVRRGLAAARRQGIGREAP